MPLVCTVSNVVLHLPSHHHHNYLFLHPQADEKELSKRLTLIEKERKDQEREEARRVKAEQKYVLLFSVFSFDYLII